ncbi:MAG: transcription elongation factor subunit Spt4 [Candidatus Woesearchaeota archaeon]
MARKKACKKCKAFVSGEECPFCNNNTFSTTWKGRVYVFDAEKSEVAERMGFVKEGEYAIKTR